MAHKRAEPLQNQGSSQSHRRDVIREHAIKEGYVAIEDLAITLGVSIMTVHRDLDALAEDGWLLKVRGGAKVHPAALLDTTIRSRSGRNVEEKRAIAAQALAHVQHGQVIFLDESTTTLAMVRDLPRLGPLTVITNSLPAINQLSNQSSIELISIGGIYRPGYDAFFGLMATEAISRLKADVLFTSTTAIERGMCCHKSEETVQLKRAFMQASAKKVLLVDHSKFGLRALHGLAPISDFDLVIVDDGISAADLSGLRAGGGTVEVAPMLSGDGKNSRGRPERGRPLLDVAD